MTSSISPAGVEAPPEVRYHRQAIQTIERDAEELVNGLDADALNWQPEPGRWSIAQNLDHVTLIARGFLPVIDRMIEQARGRAAGGEPPFRPGILAGWIVRRIEPPPGLKVKTFRRFEPAPRFDPAALIAAFLDVHQQLAAREETAAALARHGGRGHWPFLRFVTFTLGQTLDAAAAHARRHLWQARQVRQAAGFPA